MLNSFWGKFGQRENQQKTSIVKDTLNFLSILTNPNLDINHIEAINEETLVVNHTNKSECSELLNSVNVVIAAYTTAQARLKLYSCLELLGERVLNYDTDSVIFVSKEGLNEPATGDFIGDTTNELAAYGDGSYITEFVCGGPKNYAYQVFCPEKQKYFTNC